MKKIFFAFIRLWPFTFVAVFLAIQGDWKGFVIVVLALVAFCLIFDVFLFIAERNKRHKGESWRQFRRRSIEETSRDMELRENRGPIDILTPLHVYLRLDCGHIHFVVNDPDAPLKPGDTFWCHAHHWFKPAELQHITAVEKGYDLTPEERNSVKS